jgi:ribosomal protein S18 acetylase RimI-like enzyme
VQIEELSRSKSGVARFLQVPYGIYRDDPNWVAPLLADLKTVFSDRNPLFEHAEMKLWVARRDGRDVGRVAGIIDRNHNTFHQESTAFFGFFEAENDPAVARELLDAVSGWAKASGMTRLLGPMNPTTNDECGLLVEGFDSPPVIMMTYNPRYYVDLIEGAGFTKAKDLLAYHFHVDPKPLERLGRLAAGVARREPGLVVRPIRRKTLRADLAKVKEVYNAAWERNWGFVPMTDAELDFMAARLKPLLVEEITLLAELNGEPVGFMMSLPDYNEALQPLKGKLLTPKVLGFARYMLGWKRPKRARVITLGIKSSHRQRGIDAALFARSMQAGIPYGFREVEVSWMLEDNLMILRPMEVFNARRYKTYRIYERPI